MGYMKELAIELENHDAITISRNDVEYIVQVASGWRNSQYDVYRCKARGVFDTLWTLGLVDDNDNITTSDCVSSATNGIEF